MRTAFAPARMSRMLTRGCCVHILALSRDAQQLATTAMLRAASCSR